MNGLGDGFRLRVWRYILLDDGIASAWVRNYYAVK